MNPVLIVAVKDVKQGGIAEDLDPASVHCYMCQKMCDS